MPPKAENMIINVEVEVALDRIQDLLTCAFEGGSNYWYRGLHILTDVDCGEHDTHRFHLIPTIGDGEIGLYTDDDPDAPELHTLNREKIKKGLHLMAATFPTHWADVINENDDADTGDVFLQCCVFGELVYG